MRIEMAIITYHRYKQLQTVESRFQEVDQFVNMQSIQGLHHKEEVKKVGEKANSRREQVLHFDGRTEQQRIEDYGEYREAIRGCEG